MKKNPLEKALELVNGDRQNDYGHPYINFKRIAKIWSVVLDTEVTVRQVALCMMGVKMARDVNKPTDDNFDDIAGYVLAGWMADEKEKELNE